MAGGAKIFDLSQIAGALKGLGGLSRDVLGVLAGLNHDDWESYFDDMHYVATPATVWDTTGDLWTFGDPGGNAQLRTGGVAGNRAHISKTADNGGINPNLHFIYICRAEFDVGIDCTHFTGIVDALPTAADPPVEPTNAVYFRCAEVGDAGNIEAVMIAGGADTVVDTGLDVALGEGYRTYMIVGDGTNLRYFIDGVLVATIAIVAALGTLQFPTNTVVTQEANTADMLVDYVVVMARDRSVG